MILNESVEVMKNASARAERMDCPADLTGMVCAYMADSRLPGRHCIRRPMAACCSLSGGCKPVRVTEELFRINVILWHECAT